MDYGTGAIFGCPAHDQRDLDFANKYNLDVYPVVCPSDIEVNNFKIEEEAYTGPGNLVNSDFLDGLSIEEAKKTVSTRLRKLGVGTEKNKLSLKRLGYFKTAILGMPYSNYTL